MRTPPFRERRLLRAVVAATAAIFAFSFVLVRRTHGFTDGADFDQFWGAARVLRGGQDPYVLMPRVWIWPLFYPLPSVLMALPLSWLRVEVAHAAFSGLSVGAFTYAVSERPIWLLALVSEPLIHAADLGQWSPLVVAAGFIPWLGFVYAAKPTIGAAMFLYRPSWRAFWLALSFVAVSLVVMPRWPAEWLAATKRATHVRPPVAYAFGPLILLVLLRWRRPEARLIAALSCVPQTFVSYEAFPLFLVAETRLEMLVLVTLAVATEYVVRIVAPPGVLPLAERVAAQAPYRIALLYLPCVFMVLRRQNVGAVPAWLAKTVPEWMRRERAELAG